MLSYYIATDTKTSEIFLAPLGKVEIPHLIKVSNMREAERLLKKMLSGSIKKPFEKGSLFKVLEIRNDALIPGEVTIFESEHSLND